MNSATLSYQMHPFTGVLNHTRLQALFVRDTAEDIQPSVADLALEAQVRSGDYFITLATNLDQLSREAEEYHVRASLEDVVSDLIHLQDTYEIVKKSSLKQ